MNTSIVSQPNKYTCIDCGAKISRRSIRCMACKANAQLVPDSGYHELAKERNISWIGENPHFRFNALATGRGLRS